MTAFFQSARFLLPEFVTAVTADVSGAVALDLYAGVGLFTLPLSKQFEQVMAVEVAPQATANLAANARTVPGRKVRAIAGTTFDYLRRSAQMDPDLVVLDPPRAGAAAQVAELARSKVEKIVYASCDPGSFARDARALQDGGYRLEKLMPIDQFLWSAHVELIALLTRR